ncbi:MAG: HIT domain-containing protein [Ostreibacterium sp.]
MSHFVLNKQLATDTLPIIENDYYYLGLHNNKLVPWLILVPKTQEIELFACKTAFKQHIREAIDGIADFAQVYFQADKMNIATIGNVVLQLHIHIIARKKTDFAWPSPVWGKPDYADYSENERGRIIFDVKHYLTHRD